jgi:hypothetical protein
MVSQVVEEMLRELTIADIQDIEEEASSPAGLSWDASSARRPVLSLRLRRAMRVPSGERSQTKALLEVSMPRSAPGAHERVG